MTATSTQLIRYSGDGRVVKATILSNTTPAQLPATGAGIKGMEATDRFAPGSILYTFDTGKMYMTDEDGTFQEVK